MELDKLSSISPLVVDGIIDEAHDMYKLEAGGKKRILWVRCRDGERAMVLPIEMRGTAADIVFVPGTAYTFECVPYGLKVADRHTGRPRVIYGLRSYRFRPIPEDSPCKGAPPDLSKR